MLVLGSYINALDVVALIIVIIHPHIPKLDNRPCRALRLEYYTVSCSVLLKCFHTALARLENVHREGPVIAVFYTGSQAARAVLIDRCVIFELLAYRTLLAEYDLLHKVPGAPCFGHLQLAQSYKILSFGFVGIAKGDPRLLGLRVVHLPVPAELDSVVVVIVFIAVGEPFIDVAITDRKPIC